MLVVKNFLKEISDKDIVNHVDGNKTNNKVTNLEWTNYSENNLHAYKNGLNGEKINQKINKDALNKIKEFFFDKGLSQAKIASELSVSQNTISKYVRSQIKITYLIPFRTLNDSLSIE
ncbi:HNH endonuclease [Liquorilactobacillus hordei]|uniref:HNH endonuclease n=1 Tax=Liquorilactobacillus hordei TaxID=468911 RepID=UPI00112F5BED|nr:HNH endonuclease [Liquorilactobacillus hordei]